MAREIIAIMFLVPEFGPAKMLRKFGFQRCNISSDVLVYARNDLVSGETYIDIDGGSPVPLLYVVSLLPQRQTAPEPCQEDYHRL